MKQPPFQQPLSLLAEPLHGLPWSSLHVLPQGYLHVLPRGSLYVLFQGSLLDFPPRLLLFFVFLLPILLFEIFVHCRWGFICFWFLVMQIPANFVGFAGLFWVDFCHIILFCCRQFVLQVVSHQLLLCCVKILVCSCLIKLSHSRWRDPDIGTYTSLFKELCDTSANRSFCKLLATSVDEEGILGS